MNNKTAFFDAHASSWDIREVDDIADRLERVVSLSGISCGANVLDVGTGTGVLIPYILLKIGPNGGVLAIDISSEMLRQAKLKGFPDQVKLAVMDIHQTPFDSEHFDCVFCNAVFPHFEDKVGALREIARVLRPGGTVIISHPIGREAVNRIHQTAGGEVGEDRIPSNVDIVKWLSESGLNHSEVIDEPDFHLIRATKD
jgi:ubiquinone/menaquinone biosynthesis C-methylase UbiE